VLRLRIATFNTHGARPVTGPSSVRNICSFLETLNADCIALQEVHRFLPPPGVTQDQPASYRRHLGRPVTFRRSFGLGKIGYGNALVSRTEPFQVKRLLLPSVREQRSVLACDFLEEGVQYRVLCTHFGLDPEERIAQAKVVARLLPECWPTLLLGDLNGAPDSPEIRLFRDAGWNFWGDLSQPTFPVGDLSVRIDYIAGIGGWEGEGVEVVATDVSDHYAVAANVVLP
jgi:endonuclease/exonuclease/phosphatase family metal-dependent hydrolase